MTKRIVTAFFIMMIFIFASSTVYAAEYTVGPGDDLEISVWQNDSLSREIVVPPDNMLSFPLIGDVNVANMTVAQIRATIKKKLTDYVPDASVTVILKKINSLKAYVIGQVKDPGVFDITLDTHVMQALSMAKGLTPFASAGDIHILRYVGKKIEKINFDYKEVLNGKNLEQDIVLHRGDVIVVP